MRKISERTQELEEVHLFERGGPRGGFEALHYALTNWKGRKRLDFLNFVWNVSRLKKNNELVTIFLQNEIMYGSMIAFLELGKHALEKERALFTSSKSWDQIQYNHTNQKAS